MCGRVRLSSDHSEIKIKLKFDADAPAPNLDADFNKQLTAAMLLAPSVEEPLHRKIDAKPMTDLPVLRRNPETNEIALDNLRWGLIPHWMKARPEIQPINARAETISEKRMFNDAYARRRCIVPMDRFYERDKGRKQHAFGMKDGSLFGVAGIWENWRNQNGEWERTFCMITVPANELVATIHDRMPAIIPIDLHMRWLGPELDPRDLLRPFPADQLKIFRRPS
jgi:putative SOS response-associated peptidase YedK